MVRVMIVLLLAGSAVLGWLAYKQTQEIARYEAALAEGGEVDETIRSIQEKAFKYTSLKDREESEGMKGAADDQVSVAGYLRKKAQDPKVKWGNINVSEPDDKRNRDGYTDYTYRVSHSDGTAAVSRNHIANMFFLIERDLRRMKVTGIRLDTADTKADEHEVPADEWRVRFDVSIRERDKK